MTTPLEQAIPVGANFVATTMRAKLAEALIGVFTTPNLSAEDFSIQPYKALAIVGPDGDLELYAYDPTDTTTVDDGGVSCIVVSGRRYKKRIDVIVRDSAVSATTDAQPASPALGDTYILTAAPSGDDWASEAKTVATYTARGWIFREPFIGMAVYVEDEASFYHFAAGGNWTLGLGTGALPDGSVTPKKLFHPFAILKVIDQRNAPPVGTPTNGTMYQVGTSPTGAFAGHANDVARWNSGGAGAWEFFDPEEGDTIYRRDQSALYTFRSGAWGTNAPAAVLVRSYYVPDVTDATDTGSLRNRLSSPSITAQVGQKLRVTVNFASLTTTDIGTMTVGIRTDTSGSLAKVMGSFSSAGGNRNFTLVDEIDIPDANAHVYHIATQRAANSVTASNVTCRAIFEIIQPS